MNLPPCDFKPPGYSPPHTHTPLISSLALELRTLAFTTTGCLGSVPSPEPLWSSDHTTSMMAVAADLFLAFIYKRLFTERGLWFLKVDRWAESLVPL